VPEHQVSTKASFALASATDAGPMTAAGATEKIHGGKQNTRTTKHAVGDVTTPDTEYDSCKLQGEMGLSER
jgi:hypothetical protein